MSRRPTQQQRKKFKERRHQRALYRGERECPNCNTKLGPYESGHFVPPCLGDEGMFICQELKELKDAKEATSIS